MYNARARGAADRRSGPRKKLKVHRVPFSWVWTSCRCQENNEPRAKDSVGRPSEPGNRGEMLQGAGSRSAGTRRSPRPALMEPLVFCGEASGQSTWPPGRSQANGKTGIGVYESRKARLKKRDWKETTQPPTPDFIQGANLLTLTHVCQKSCFWFVGPQHLSFRGF